MLTKLSVYITVIIMKEKMMFLPPFLLKLQLSKKIDLSNGLSLTLHMLAPKFTTTGELTFSGLSNVLYTSACALSVSQLCWWLLLFDIHAGLLATGSTQTR